MVSVIRLKPYPDYPDLNDHVLVMLQTLLVGSYVISLVHSLIRLYARGLNFGVSSSSVVFWGGQ